MVKMYKTTGETHENSFARCFWLDMRILMANKITIRRKRWYNTYIFDEKNMIYSAK